MDRDIAELDDVRGLDGRHDGPRKPLSVMTAGEPEVIGFGEPEER